MNNQDFRFCCGCQRLSLINDGKCFFCQSTFIVHSAKGDFNNHKVKQYYKRKKENKI